MDELREFMLEASRRKRLALLENHASTLKITQQMLSLNEGSNYSYQPAKEAHEMTKTAFKQVSFSTEENEQYKDNFLKKYNEKRGKNKFVPFHAVSTTILGALCFGATGLLMLKYLFPLLSSGQELLMLIAFCILTVVVWVRS